MNRQVKVIIAALAAAVVVLSIALGVALAGDGNNSIARMMSDGDGYSGMMGAFVRMDCDEMLERMREVLGPEDYQRMLDHIAEHRHGGDTAGPGHGRHDAPNDGRNDAADAGRSEQHHANDAPLGG
jgi:hypothetical protein